VRRSTVQSSIYLLSFRRFTHQSNSGKPINLRNKNRTATCFCHTILEFAAAEKSLGLYGGKIEINSSWTGV
jgi:hypothetical protein